MVVVGESGCIRVKGACTRAELVVILQSGYLGKVIVFGLRWWYLGKMFVFGNCG